MQRAPLVSLTRPTPRACCCLFTHLCIVGILDEGLADLEGFDQALLQPAHAVKTEPSVPKSPSTEVETSLTNLKISTTGAAGPAAEQSNKQGNVFQNRKGFNCPPLNLSDVDTTGQIDFKMSPSAADFAFSPTANMPLSPATLNK